jgi:hypothetical protein
MAQVKPEDEEVFNKWYNEDHLPKAIARFPGVLSGRRYKILEGEEEYRYLAMYEFESYETMHARYIPKSFKVSFRSTTPPLGKAAANVSWQSSSRLLRLGKATLVEPQVSRTLGRCQPEAPPSRQAPSRRAIRVVW